MYRGAHVTAGPSRRRQNAPQRNAGFRDTGLDLSRLLPDPSPSSPDQQPESGISLRRHIAQTLRKHHRSIETSNHALQPVSPASYGSSLEVAPYNPAVTPSSSLEFTGRAGEAHYNLKTSTELLKVLNRIWSLEEQHAANISLIKALKTDLAHARVRIKELLRDQQADRHELDDLMKQITDNKLSRKTKEHERLNSAIQSIREELEDERKLRKRSESLHRKLARELSEVKSSLSNCVKELDRERKSRKSLENLCDEFASGIKSYEQEIHALKQKLDKDWIGKADQDRVILHVAESWLDERMQMMLEKENSGFGNDMAIEKLGFEIETFLRARTTETSNENPCTLPRYRRNSVESVPLNDAISAPRDVGDEDSAGSNSNCFELKKPSNGDLESAKQTNGDSKLHVDELVRHSQPNKEASLVGKSKGQSRNPSNLQVKFEEQMARAKSTCNGKNKSRVIDTEDGSTNPAEISVSQKSENCEITKEGSHEKKNKCKRDETTQGMMNSNHVIGEMIRNHMLLSERHENDDGEASCSYPSLGQASSVRQWMSRIIKPDLDVSEASIKPAQGAKEATLKSKLVERRSKSSHPPLRLFKSSS